MARNFYMDYSNGSATLMDGDTGKEVGTDLDELKNIETNLNDIDKKNKPVVETKDSFGFTPKQNRQIENYLTRPPSDLTKAEKKKVVKDFYSEAEASDQELYSKLINKEPLRYLEIMNSRYGNQYTGPHKTPKGYPREETKFKYVSKLDELIKTDKYGNAESATDRIQEKDKFVNILPLKDKSYPKAAPKAAPKAVVAKPIEQDSELEKSRKNLDRLILAGAIEKIDGAASGIGGISFDKAKSKGVAGQLHLNDGGPANKPPTLEQYLKLGLSLANLTEDERRVVQDLLDKSLPKK